jgi:hypothetical protein
MRSAEVDLLALTSEVDLTTVPELADARTERLELVVAVVGIVMEQEEATCCVLEWPKPARSGYSSSVY